jgi:thioredoxin-related protein
MLRFLPGLLLVPILLAAASSVAAAPNAVAWRAWNPGLREAAQSGRPVVVDVYTDWCGWCKRMDRDVYARADVRDYLNKRFVSIRLDAEAAAPASYEGKAFTSRSLAARFRVSGYPTTIFLKPDGGHIANVPGYVPADRFLLLLRYVGEGHLDRGLSFEQFVERESRGR